jgi:hypothetical protein
LPFSLRYGPVRFFFLGLNNASASSVSRFFLTLFDSILTRRGRPCSRAPVVGITDTMGEPGRFPVWVFCIVVVGGSPGSKSPVATLVSSRAGFFFGPAGEPSHNRLDLRRLHSVLARRGHLPDRAPVGGIIDTMGEPGRFSVWVFCFVGAGESLGFKKPVAALVSFATGFFLDPAGGPSHNRFNLGCLGCYLRSSFT